MRKYKMLLRRVLTCGLCLSMLTGCSGKKTDVSDTDTKDIVAEQSNHADNTGKDNQPSSGNSSNGGNSDFISGIRAKYADDEAVEYADAMYNLEKNHVFVYENLPEKFFDHETYECFKVYYDAEFENFVDITVENDYFEKTVTISPNLTFDYNVPQSSTANDGTWGTRSKFWLVRYVDLESGEMLDKPVVTIFTIRQDLDTPTLTQSVDSQGYYHLSWTEVEGADYYEVYALDIGIDYAEIEFTTDAKTTECNYEDFETAKGHEERFREKYGDTEINVDDKWLMNEMLLPDYSYFVVAKTNDGKSSGMSNDCAVEDIQNQIPYERSWDFLSEYEGDSILALPAYVDVEMLDGSISKYLIEYNGATVYLLEDGTISVWPTIKNLPIGMMSISLKGVDYEEFMSQTNLLKEREEQLEGKSGTASQDINIPYVPKKDEVNAGDSETRPNADETTNEDETANEDGTANENETGNASETSNEDEPANVNEPTTANDSSSTEETGIDNPNTKEDNNDYDIKIGEELENTIYANTAVGEWIAYNLLAHNEYISLAQFPESSDTEYLKDAFLEAYTQNPLCGIIEGVYYDYTTNMLNVDYVLSKEETEEMQSESLKKAKEIAGEIIKSSMSDYEKEEAINRYLCENASYNENIFDYIGDDGTVSRFAVYDYANSFTPYGILVENVGVCESYSEAFLLIAKEARLEAVIETGVMGGVSHEWNRVKIGSEWYTLDVTNNDMEYIPNCYFNLSDDIAGTIYQEDRGAFVDQYIKKYTAKNMDNEYYTKNNLYTEDKKEAVSMLAKQLEKNDMAVIRMSSDLKEKEVDDIVKNVVKNAKLSSGKYYYNAGVISVTKK